MSARRAFVNALTFLRVPLIFAWLVLAMAEEFRGGFWLGFWACAAMFLAGLTDAFDGALARKWDVVSQLGKMADPLMDKVFYVVAFPSLTWLIMKQGGPQVHGIAMLIFTILYILRDLWVTFIRSVGAMFGADVAAMWLGKVRTALSFPAAGWIYLYLAIHRSFPEWETPWIWSCYVVESVMIAINVVSFITYTGAYMPYLRKALERK